MSAPAAIPYDSFIAEFYDHPTVTVRRDLYLSAAREYGDAILELDAARAAFCCR